MMIRKTEQRNPRSTHIDTMSTREMVDLIVPVIVELRRLVGKANPETVHKQRISRQELSPRSTHVPTQEGVRELRL